MLLVQHVSSLCILFECVGEDLVVDGKGDGQAKVCADVSREVRGRREAKAKDERTMHDPY